MDSGSTSIETKWSAEDQDKAEEAYLELCERLPEELVRKKVRILAGGPGARTQDLETWIERLARDFGVTQPKMTVRLLQIFPELRRKFSLPG